MEHAQLQGGDGQTAQVLTVNGQQLQVLQMNNPSHMIQGPNGQQIVVHAIPASQSSIQVATPGGQQLQQIQVLPISNLQGGTTTTVQQPMQLVQTADGQTFLYQPPAQATQTIDQHQILHQPTVINLNGNLVQLGVGTSVQQPAIVNQPNIVMMVNGGASSSAGAGSSGDAHAGAGSADDEPLLYVNARQYKRIIKRRAARARLHELGKIPKERPKYLHESRHRHAMNRIRGEGGRFHSGMPRDKSEDNELSVEKLNEMKPDGMSITIIHQEEDEEATHSATQWRRLAPHQPHQQHQQHQQINTT